MLEQPEMAELDRILVLAEIFIEAGGCAVDVEHADIVALVVQRRRQLLVDSSANGRPTASGAPTCR